MRDKGAGRGLGRAYARRLAGLGAKIAVTDLNLKSYTEFEAEAKAMTGDSTVDEINAVGGYLGRPIQLVVKDDQANPDVGLKVSQELLKENVVATIGLSIAMRNGLRAGYSAEAHPFPSLFADKLFNIAGVTITLVWSGTVSAILYYLVDKLFGLRPSVDVEREGLDITEHGERAYNH